MAGITVTRETLQALGGVEISSADWTALRPVVIGVLASSYRGDIDAAEGRAASVLNAVFTAVALRLFTNPTGARSVSLGDTSVTTGGSDAALAAPLSLTPDERKDLQRIRKPIPSYVEFTTLPQHETVFLGGLERDAE